MRGQPWLGRKSNETRPQQLDRIAHSCYRCGTVINDPAALSEHEDTCTGQAPSS